MKHKAHTLLRSLQQIDKILELITSHPEPLLKDLDAFPAAISISTPAGIYLKVNKAYCQLFGYPEKELIGDTFAKLIPEEVRQEATEAYIENFEQGIEYKGTVMEVINKKGKRFSIVFNNVNIENSGGTHYRLGIMTDVTDIQTAERRLGQTLKRLSTEVRKLETKVHSQETARSALLHDIKKPFQNILGVCTILSSPQVSRAEKQLWVNTILEICQKGLQQTDAMQGITQMEEGIFKAELRTLDLLTLLQQTIDSIRSPINDKEIDCSILYKGEKYPAGQHCEMEGEPLYLELLFSNLLMNAVEASLQKQAVTFTVYDSDQSVTISLHNQGAVPQSIRKAFFEKYITKGKAKGTGMGTYIARMIVEAHHGQISLETSGESGTTIIVRLPKRQFTRKAA